MSIKLILKKQTDNDYVFTLSNNVKILVHKPDIVDGIAIMSIGGVNKVSDPDNPNFLIRTRSLIAEKQYMTVYVDSRTKHINDVPFKLTKEYSYMVTMVIAKLKEYFGITDVPIWCIGTSRGAPVSINLSFNMEDITGVCLLAALTLTTHGSPSVLEMPLEDVKHPVFIGVHKKETCYVTTIEGNFKTYLKLTNSVGKEYVLFEGGRLPRGADVTGPLSHHGFIEIEDVVIDRMFKFIKGVRYEKVC